MQKKTKRKSDVMLLRVCMKRMIGTERNGDGDDDDYNITFSIVRMILFVCRTSVPVPVCVCMFYNDDDEIIMGL